MEVLFHKKFLKDLDAMPPAYKSRVEKLVFETLPRLRNVKDIQGAEKLKGYSAYYKIRFGDYRVGFRVASNAIILERVLHRKEIYRYFPIE